MAVALDEPMAAVCQNVLNQDAELLISSATIAEALIVAGRAGVHAEMVRLIDGLGLTILDVTPASATRVAEAYGKWGKGVHPARLNFGDCFSYEVAREHGCPLLFVGNDFSKTDLQSVL